MDGDFEDEKNSSQTVKSNAGRRNSSKMQIRRKSGANWAQVRRKSGTNPVPTEAKEDGTESKAGRHEWDLPKLPT